MSFISFMLRTAFRRSDDKRDAGLTTPEGIERFDDLRYGEDARWNLLDVYRPKGIEGKLPVIVSVHGGGWVYGDKERYQYYCMSLAEHGFAVVNFTYRLAPKHKFPAALEDTNAVFHWLMRHGADYGLEPSRVFGVGDSAGAQLLGLFNADAEMLKIGVPAQRIISLCFPLAALGIISGSIFQAFSQSIYSLIISLGRQLVVLLPAAWLLSKTGNVTNVWWAFPIAEGVSVVLSFIFFRMIYGKIVKPLEQPNP